MSTTYGIDADLADAPISARLVYAVLDRAEDELTQQEIVEATHLGTRTVRQALEELEDRDAIVKGPYLKDPRQSLYYVSRTDNEM